MNECLCGKRQSRENLTPDFPIPWGRGSSMAFGGVTPSISPPEIQLFIWTSLLQETEVDVCYLKQKINLLKGHWAAPWIGGKVAGPDKKRDSAQPKISHGDNMFGGGVGRVGHTWHKYHRHMMPTNRLLTQLPIGTVVPLSQRSKPRQGQMISQVQSLGHAVGVCWWEGNCPQSISFCSGRCGLLTMSWCSLERE